MKNFKWIGLALIATSSSAFADGFRCDGQTFGTKIEIYNKLKPSEGTRNASVMVVSDPASQKGERTIATFSKEQKILIQRGATYIATVDSRFKTVKAGDDKRIAGTTLSQLETIVVQVAFNYRMDTPSQAGQKYIATVTFTKEDGEDIIENMVCTRYKK